VVAAALLRLLLLLLLGACGGDGCLESLGNGSSLAALNL
jgi:hypothetical protein